MCKRASDYAPLVHKLDKTKYDIQGSQENLKLQAFLDLLEEIRKFVDEYFSDTTFYRKMKHIAYRETYYERVVELNSQLTMIR